METESKDSEEEMPPATNRLKLPERNCRKAPKKFDFHAAKLFAENQSMFHEAGDNIRQVLEKFDGCDEQMKVISVHFGNLLDVIKQSMDLASKRLGELSAPHQIAAASNERAHDLFHNANKIQSAYETTLESEFGAENLAEHEARKQYVLFLRLSGAVLCVIYHIISPLT
jgi:hypothetical protein